MGWRHRVHMTMGGRARHLAQYAAGEVSPAEGRSVEVLLQDCPECRREVVALRVGLAALRASPPASLSPAEAASFWPEVERRIARGAVSRSRPVRPGLRELVGDHPRLSLASAMAAVALVLGLTLGQVALWGPASPGRNGVEILSVEAGEETSVMLFQVPGSTLRIIWVFEPPDTL